MLETMLGNKTLLRVIFIIIHNSIVLNIFKMLWKHVVIILHDNILCASDINSSPVDEKDQMEESWQFP